MKQLEAQQPVLRQMSRELENTFLKVGSCLEQLTEGTSRLLARCEALRKLQTGGDTDGTLKPVMQLLNAPLEFLGLCKGHLQELTVELLTADRQIEGVLSSSAEVRRALAPLSFMPVLFRMESVHLPAETQQMFVALTDEIQRLHVKFLGAFTVRLDILDKSRGTVQLGISKLEELVAEHQCTTESQRLQVQQTLLALREELDRNQRRDTGLAKVSRNTSRKVGEIVVGLQSQDIISQRLAHVLEALSQLTDRYQVAQNHGDATALGQFALYASQTARLQLGQLHGIVQEAAQAEKTIQSGLQSILDSIVEMERGCEAGEDLPEASGTGTHGHAYIAPGGKHMQVVREGFLNRIHLHEGPPENSCRPAVDVLFRSVAGIYGAATLGVILTGMGQDGMRGCELIRERQGQVLAQDEASSVVWGMPGAVVQASLADKVLPLDQVCGEIVRRVGENRRKKAA